MQRKSTRTWYGDKLNRRCDDCGEKTDWDERLRLGYYAIGGPAHPDGSPMYDPARAYGNTPAGLAEQAKLNAHCDRFHNGGMAHEETAGAWKLEIHRYSTGTASSREMLKARRPFYAIVSTEAPDGGTVERVLHGFRTVADARFAAFPNVVHEEKIEGAA